MWRLAQTPFKRTMRPFLYGDLVCVRNFCGQRRISSIVRTIAHGVAERRADRHQRRVFWAGSLFGGRAEAEIPGQDEFGLNLVAARSPQRPLLNRKFEIANRK